MATDLSATSLFTKVNIGWHDRIKAPNSISFQTNTDEDNTYFRAEETEDYDSPAADSLLGLLQANYAANDGELHDDDGFALTLTVRSFTYAEDITVEDLPSYGFFNPLDPDGYANWLDYRKIEGAHLREADYSQDPDTGRPRVSSSIDDIPIHRNPGADTYEFLLDKWTVMQIGTQIDFRRTWSNDDGVTNSNINDNFDVLAFIDWWDDLRISGDELPDNIKELSTFQNRTFRLVQGTGYDTLDLEINGRSHNLYDNNNYEWVNISFRRISTETGTIDIGAVRAVLGAATGTLDTSDEDLTPEIPQRGEIDTPIHASEIIFPDGLRMRPQGTRLTLSTPERGAIPVDGASVRAVRWADLDDVSGETNTKYMPNDGAAVVHFGHDETADGAIRYRDIEDMVLADGSDVVQRVHNISADYDCTIQDDDGDTLLILQPFQQSGPMQASLEAGGEAGEILAINPPDRHAVLRRGVSGTVFSQGVSYAQDNNQNPHNYHSLNLPNSALVFQDSDGISAGSGPNPSSAIIGTINRSLWAIKGSYDIEWPGWITMRIRYRLTIVGPAPSGELATGNGIALWIAEGATGALTLHHFTGAESLGGTGASLEYHLIHRGKHAKDTRFVLFHRIPNGSDIAESDYDHIHMEALEGTITLEPEIRKVITP